MFIEWLQLTSSYITLLIGVVITLKSLYGLFSGSSFGLGDRLLSNFFLLFLYLQFLSELFIFVTTRFRYEDSIRASEHIALTLFAVIMTTGGRIITSRSNDSLVKFRFRSLYYGVATGLLIYAFILVL